MKIKYSGYVRVNCWKDGGYPHVVELKLIDELIEIPDEKLDDWWSAFDSEQDNVRSFVHNNFRPIFSNIRPVGGNDNRLLVNLDFAMGISRNPAEDEYMALDPINIDILVPYNRKEWDIMNDDDREDELHTYLMELGKYEVEIGSYRRLDD